MLRIPVTGGAAFVTIGMCQRPQPVVELHHEDPAPFRRIELGICLSSALGAEAERKAAEYLAGQARLPWARYTWLGEGHTVPCDARGDTVAAVLLQARPHGASVPDLPAYRGDPVSLLWMLPVTASEREVAVREGSQTLARRLADDGRGWMYHPPRRGWRSFFSR